MKETESNERAAEMDMAMSRSGTEGGECLTDERRTNFGLFCHAP